MTNKDVTKIAKKYGYYKINGYCHGQPIFTNGKYFISHDIDSHNGGFWKKAESKEKLRSKKSRCGTYKKDTITRIGR